MSVTPNKYGPFCPCGEITSAAAGTALPLSTNFPAAFAATPNAPVTDAAPQQYAIAFEDLIINSPPNNAGGIYLVTYDTQGATGSKNNVDTILLYIPKGSLPVSVKKYFGGSRINPNSVALDFDQAGDKCWPVGVIGS